MELKNLNWYKLGLIFGLLLIFIVTPVMAVTGSFIAVGGLTQNAYTAPPPGGGGHYMISGIYLKNIQNQSGLSAIISVATSGLASTDSNSTAVNLYAGDTIIGAGTFGYVYDAVAAKYNAYLYVSSLDVGTRTGDHYINFTTLSGVSAWCLGQFQTFTTTGIGTVVSNVYFSQLGNSVAESSYIKYQSRDFHNTYVVSYSAPITTIDVTKVIGSLPYPSKVYIMQGTTVLAANTTLTSDPFHVAIAGAPYLTINVTDQWGGIFASPLIYGAGTAPLYSISVLPSNITITTSASGGVISTLDPILAGLTDISWKWSDETGTYNFNEGGNVSRLVSYTKKSDSNWYGYEIGSGGLGGQYNLNKGTNVPNPVTLANIPTTGNKTITCFIGTSDGNWYTLTAPLTVGGGGGAYITTRATMIDWLTGNRIYYGTISFQNIATGIWTNITPSTGDGSVAASSTPMTMWNIYGSASGYANANRLGVPATSTGIYSLFMYSQSNITAALGQTTLYVTVEDDTTFAGIGGAHVTVSTVADQTYLSLKSTASNGVATFYVPNNTEYWVGAQAEGYMGNTQKISIALEPLFSYHLALHLKTAPTPAVPTIPPGVQQPGGVPGVTIAPGQTYAPSVTYTWAPTQTYLTPRPTTTVPGYQPATGNFTGFWAPFLNLGVAMGADPSEVGILMALVLSLGGLVIGSIGPSMFTGTAVFSPIGGEIGAFLGIAGSVAFGFFPLYLSIIVVVGLILYVSLRVYGVTR